MQKVTVPQLDIQPTDVLDVCECSDGEVPYIRLEISGSDGYNSEGYVCASCLLRAIQDAHAGKAARCIINTPA